jgi:hypothetical protein
MERIKSVAASVLIALIVFAGFGFGILALGFAIVLGTALALTIRLMAPKMHAEADAETDGAWREGDVCRPQAA